MPKLKTKKSAKKRFRITGGGKIKRKKAFLRHILTSKRRGRKRQLKMGAYVSPSNAKEIRRLLPYG